MKWENKPWRYWIRREYVFIQIDTYKTSSVEQWPEVPLYTIYCCGDTKIDAITLPTLNTLHRHIYICNRNMKQTIPRSKPSFWGLFDHLKTENEKCAKCLNNTHSNEVNPTYEHWNHALRKLWLPICVPCSRSQCLWFFAVSHIHRPAAEFPKWK